MTDEDGRMMVSKWPCAVNSDHIMPRKKNKEKRGKEMNNTVVLESWQNYERYRVSI